MQELVRATVYKFPAAGVALASHGRHDKLFRVRRKTQRTSHEATKNLCSPFDVQQQHTSLAACDRDLFHNRVTLTSDLLTTCTDRLLSSCDPLIPELLIWKLTVIIHAGSTRCAGIGRSVVSGTL